MGGLFRWVEENLKKNLDRRKQMLDKDLITIYKIKQAYELNDQEADTLINVIGVEKVYPFKLIENAFDIFWNKRIEERDKQYNFSTTQSFMPMLASPEYFYAKDYAELIEQILKRISSVIEPDCLELGLDYILKITFDDKELERLLKCKEKLLRLMWHFVAYPLNPRNMNGIFQYTRIPDKRYEFFSQIFQDIVVVDKIVAIKCLESLAYSFRKEVKGITRELVEKIISGNIEPQAGLPYCAELNTYFVNKQLWHDQHPPKIRDRMRTDQFPDYVIAYVLFNWCNKSKTEIGRLLRTSEQTSSTDYRQARKLLKLAESVKIDHA